MTDQHPITPPPELVQQWIEATRSNDCIGAYPKDYEHLVGTQAARWGADQELEACCEWLCDVDRWKIVVDRLRAARRPKPPSLKEQALDWCNDYIDPDGIIRRALEALPDD
jgi:hypothetical protein